MVKGYLAFVLHAHLPFVRHPEYDRFLEERWLFEAITETYIPLLQMLDGLAADRVPARLSLSLSPSLLAMLEDPLLTERYQAHLRMTLELCEREVQRNAGEAHFRWLAEVYHGWFNAALALFERHQGRLARGFAAHAEQGRLELMTTTATHGLLPLLATQPRSVEFQLITGLDYFASVFGQRPQGLWLPECGYYPGLDNLLAREGIRWFCVESTAIDHADIAPIHGVHAPLYTPGGVAALGRDQESTKEVWSAEVGFPGDPDYREFYRDLGHDLAFEQVRPYMPGDLRCDTGIKYYRITGPTSWKEPYQPERAREKAAQHAGVFLQKRIAHIEYLSSQMPVAPLVMAPFDAELFGHWWFEGPQWLDFVIRKAAYDQSTLALATPSDYLDRHPVQQRAVPACSTWGFQGYFETWLNPRNDWIYAELKQAAARMERLALDHRDCAPDAEPARVLNQCARELLLAQSSDWPFIISNGTSEEYAIRRVKDHIARFHVLADGLEQADLDPEWLLGMEYLDNLFPNIDFRHYVGRDR